MSESEQLEREAERCRVQFSETLDELRARVTPGNLVDEVIEYARESTGGRFADNLRRQIANNPLPVALMGASLTWLMLGRNRANGSGSAQSSGSPRGWRGSAPAHQSVLGDTQTFQQGVGHPASRRATAAVHHGDGAAGESVLGDAQTFREGVHPSGSGWSDYASDLQSRAGETAKEWTDSAAASAGEMASQAQGYWQDAKARAADAASRLSAGAGDAAGSAASGAREGFAVAAQTTSGFAATIGNSAANTGRTLAAQTSSFVQLCREQPLVLAGIGVAIGAVLGAVLPGTKTEDQMMGETSDQARQKAQEFAARQVDKARAVGEHVYEEAQSEAAKQGLTPEAVAHEAKQTSEEMSPLHPQAGEGAASQGERVDVGHE